MFLLRDGSVMINECAPRPHNSGHYTIEACETDQFEQHMRAVSGLPLGSTNLKVEAAVMVNILGRASGEEGLAVVNAQLRRAVSVPGVGVHWYGKKEARAGRKMGHLTAVGGSLAAAWGRARAATGEPKQASAAHAESVLVGIVMGSDSDLPCMKAAAEVLQQFGVEFELTIISAHRTPDRMCQWAKQAHHRGMKVVIAGAGGAAHLPGMVAAMTPLPVIGVPVKSAALSGLDSLLSIVQMPRGVPVATVAIGNAANAGLLAVKILAASDPALLVRLSVFMETQEREVEEKAEKLESLGWANYLSEMPQ
mmetsp:Transcript_23074/g.53966  ORF Transcript_23074/g.53966 Transcript_23074/m.53966 type:complete len:309 (+) Transcript_23074:895-1821(+)